MPYMYSEMQNKLSKIRESPLESMGQIISSRCPSTPTTRQPTGMIISKFIKGHVSSYVLFTLFCLELLYGKAIDFDTHNHRKMGINIYDKESTERNLGTCCKVKLLGGANGIPKAVHYMRFLLFEQTSNVQSDRLCYM